MSKPYPILESKTLPPTAKGGLLGLGSRKRGPGDLPPRVAGQALVYLVDGRHVIDNGRLDPGDDTVVRATHVSVVDLTVNRGVAVELTIPSADAKQFTVRATFRCTVMEPDKVVKHRQDDAVTVLGDYLRGYQRLSHLAQDYKISAVNEVRLLVQSQVESYHRHVPPDAPGMRVVLASVEVLTPEELVAFHNRRFEDEQNYVTASAHARYEMELRQQEAAHEERLELLKKSYELKLGEQQHILEMARQQSRQQLTGRENRFNAGEARLLRTELGDDPWTASHYAHQRGEVTAQQMAADLHEARADAEARRRELEDRDGEFLRIERERHWASVERDAAWAREERLKSLTARLEVLKELAKHGHLDEVGIDELDHLMDRMVGPGGPGGPGADGASGGGLNRSAEPRAELPDGDEPFSEED